MKCQHAGCQCTEATVERNGRSYCSQDCAEEKKTSSSTAAGRGCACGHAECSGVT